MKVICIPIISFAAGCGLCCSNPKGCQIGQILGISQPTLRSYFDLYLQGGVEALKQLNYQGKANLLLERQDEIISALEAEPPTTLKQAQARIKAATGLHRSLPQVREFLKKTNFGVGK